MTTLPLHQKEKANIQKTKVDRSHAINRLPVRLRAAHPKIANKIGALHLNMAGDI